ncbi:MAG TPA: allantoinase AllB [Candidatus Sulfopaludibacter sp.]|jgi:allantoinase|nr:allantoinase AllB [Candidatus Sulfopaludibacter sp.]
MIVRGGNVATADGVVAADFAVEDGRIAAMGPELPGGGEEIDARGLTVFPGLIDVHVHFNEPGRAEWEGAGTGSSALAAGGGTLYFDMPLNSSPCTVDGAAFDEKREALERASYTDFALWGGIVPGNGDRLEELAERGVIGFKAFMADSGLAEFPRSDDRTLYDAMRTAARLGLPVAVHAENNDLVRHVGSGSIRDYLDSRPVIAEVEAIRRAAVLAKEAGAKLHIVHISSGRGVAEALEARAGGADISIETCAHYLYFTDEDMVRIGAVAKCAPPLRPAVERERLRTALLRGEIDIVGSDHSPAPLSMKQDDDFFRVWGGIGGVQSTLAVLLASGCTSAQIALVAGRRPAERFGIAGKGRMAVGYDADFTLVDLHGEYTVTRERLFQRHGLSPYLGARFRGVVRRTVLRGRTIFEDGKMAGPPSGRMVTAHATTRIHT